MKKMLWAVVAMLALVGCRNPYYSGADGKIVCALDGKSFISIPGAGSTTFLKRTPDADALCKSRVTVTVDEEQKEKDE